MATAAFKSNSKRSDGYGGRDSSKTNPSPNPKPNPQKPKLRRSLSVNALSRSTQLDIPTEFLNKRENPLYWATGGSPTVDNNIETPSPVDVAAAAALESKSSDVRVGQRGRSVNRSSDLRNGGQKGEISGRRRSLSRVNDTGSGNGRLGRSVSRAKLGYGASESEADQESRKQISHGARGRASSSTGKLPVSGVKSFERSSRPSVGSSFDSQVSNCEDGISTGSLSEAEEKTIKAVYEQMKSFEVDSLRKDTASNEIYETVRSEVRRAIADIQDDLHDAIRRNSNGALVSTDLSPKLVKPGAVELVLDIRREYAKELEASQERARKLRSDLAIEEHHKQELSRILKETLPEPKTSSSHRSRLGRKSSSERKKMSKRLTDEALSYFDECVSISTFDSSDFSAAEDPSVNSVTPAPSRCIDQQMVHGNPVSSSVVDSSCNELVMDRVVETTSSTEQDRKFLFSFGHKQTESMKLQHDIESYIKSFEKDKTTDGTRRNYNFNTDVYQLLDVNESLLFDTVFFRNRQESGSLHICGAAVVPFLPFPHFF
ncbi:hypothetical protein L1987_68614 [Smallanthus sonchifolius]|uniref:Uncharacterized protein n=1 Tax=Smallanthus sonchifolius TaxID=185202 RepID=A0ACB9B525_9ASTR|nr:hypothetical protein L1987_68614 [Smallanthus sonchifolius]